jgi:hypothetical protein
MRRYANGRIDCPEIIMKTKLTSLWAAVFICVTHAGVAAEDGTRIPYNSVNKSMSILKSQKVKGVECVPWFIRNSKKGEVLDPDKARFRLRTWEGQEHILDIEPLIKVPAGQLTDLEKKLMADGYTYRLWIPKGKKEFMDGDLLHSLPKGSIEMSQGLYISGGKRKDPKQ